MRYPCVVLVTKDLLEWKGNVAIISNLAVNPEQAAPSSSFTST
jgi:hypothetical protein